MSTKNLIYGIFDSDDNILDAAYKMRDMGVSVDDCYTPHPVHHLDAAIGVKRTRLSIAAFICGSIGFCTAIFMEMYMNVFDWPMNIGGKPNDGFYMVNVPVTFEMTVLFTAYGMGILFFMRAGMMFGAVEKLVDLRQTDDLYVIAIDLNKQRVGKDSITSALMDMGALEVRNKAHFELQQA